MKKFRPLLLLLAAVFLLTASGCKKEKEPCFTLTEYLIETQSPSYVNVFFQVTDNENKGVTDLTASDFTLLENGTAISPTESDMRIRKADELPYTIKTVLLLDNSLSLSQADLDKVKQAAIALVNSKESNQVFAVYKFSEFVEEVQPFTGDISTLTTAINSIQRGASSTNLYGAVITGASAWTDVYSISAIEQGFLVVLSDGSDTQGSRTLAEAKSSTDGKKVYTIGLGSEIDQAALKSLGNSGFFQITDVNELTAKFDEIQDDIKKFANSFYWLNYLSPKRGNNEHQLTLKLNKNCPAGNYINGTFNSASFFSATQGVYVNGGRTSFELVAGGSLSLSAQTVLGSNNSNYTWVSSNPSITSMTISGAGNSSALINGAGNTVGQSFSITVTDVANSLSTVIQVQVVDQPTGVVEDFTGPPANNSYISWNTGGWYADVLNGTSAPSYRSQLGLGSSGVSTMSAVVNVPSGTNSVQISFNSKVSSENGYDYLRFKINGNTRDSWSGEQDWTPRSFTNVSSSSTLQLEWSYEKDGSIDGGQNAGWIDDVVITFN
ncbi:MAG TPA: VWA domain-containing protein [Chitinophagales bacterium]|nr:VWA domain-containing protein [Chitinophagales bacterium]